MLPRKALISIGLETREVKQLAQSHTATQRQTGVNLSLPDSGALALVTHHCSQYARAQRSVGPKRKGPEVSGVPPIKAAMFP